MDPKIAQLALLIFLCFFQLLVAKDFLHEAEKCTATNCLPPNCRCSDNFNPPGKLDTKSTPQIIMITFDDDLNSENFPHYKEAFQGLKNPNGCPAVGTFFICHNYTSYFLAETMYSMGHELADHSVTHQTPTEYWLHGSYDVWKNEINGEREILHQ